LKHLSLFPFFDFINQLSKICDSCNLFPEICNALLLKRYHLCATVNLPVQTSILNNMSNLLYIIAIILIILWATGYYAYNFGNVIHILLVIAIVAILLRVIRGRNVL